MSQWQVGKVTHEMFSEKHIISKVLLKAAEGDIDSLLWLEHHQCLTCQVLPQGGLAFKIILPLEEYFDELKDL